MAFIRTIEDFVCEHCGALVKGNGYTNHCPSCLWGKHVDVSPGDRAESCMGLMEPIRIEGIVDRYEIVHRCTVCTQERRVRVADNDDHRALIALAEKFANAPKAE